MLANLIIGLREGLEAALVIGLILAALRRTGRDDLAPRIWMGVGLAIALCLAIGAALTFGTYSLSEQAQEIITGVLSIVAVGLITWMILWMAATAATMRGRITTEVANAAIGSGRALVAVAFIAVAREGTETALFLWAATRAADDAALAVLGAVLGLLIAVALGWLLFRGLVRIDIARFFAWSGALLVIVAAGVLAYGIHELQEAGVVPGPEQVVPAGVPEGLQWMWGWAFQLGDALPADSLLGSVLTGAFGITASMSWLQVIAWVAYVAIVMTAFVLTLRRRTAAAARTAASRAADSEPVPSGAPPVRDEAETAEAHR